MSSQVKLLITNNAFCIVQRATAQPKTGFFRDYAHAVLLWDWKHNFVDIFDPTLLIPRDKVEESADDSSGMRYAEWDVARLFFYLRTVTFHFVRTSVESVYSI
jgi:hypothetical protein